MRTASDGCAYGIRLEKPVGSRKVLLAVEFVKAEIPPVISGVPSKKLPLLRPVRGAHEAESVLARLERHAVPPLEAERREAVLYVTAVMGAHEVATARDVADVLVEGDLKRCAQLIQALGDGHRVEAGQLGDANGQPMAK
jgi:hypothetical protein